MGPSRLYLHEIDFSSLRKHLSMSKLKFLEMQFEASWAGASLTRVVVKSKSSRLLTNWLFSLCSGVYFPSGLSWQWWFYGSCSRKGKETCIYTIDTVNAITWFISVSLFIFSKWCQEKWITILCITFITSWIVNQIHQDPCTIQIQL